MNRHWWRFYGLQLGLTIEQVEDMRFGEFSDLLSCQRIASGVDIPVKRKLTMEEILAM